MSLYLVKKIFSALPHCREWHAHLLNFTCSNGGEMTYNCRRIELEPTDRLITLIQDIAEGYVSEGKNRMNKYADVREYDGTCNSTTIYRISEDNMERTYKIKCVGTVSKIEELNIIFNPQIFRSTATSGHNPRRFVAFSQSKLQLLTNKKNREIVAKYFNIPLTDDKRFDISQKADAENLV